jgi:hypothetical protein
VLLGGGGVEGREGAGVHPGSLPREFLSHPGAMVRR